MKRSGIKLFLIVIITCLILLSCKSSFTHIDITNQNILSSSSFPEIVFNYNSTYTKQIFTAELQLELDSFNILTLFFLTSGYKTNSEGIKVTFIIEQTEVIFTIERLFQDSLNHNLTQLFSFPEAFAGKKNITVICEAQTSYFYQAGTLQIASQTTIEKILPQILTETPFSLPIFPDWIRFKGSTVSTIRKSITAVFNNSHDFDKLNFSLSFLTNDFSAYKQYFEIEINNLIVNTRNFEENQQISVSFLSDINLGINLINIYFSVEMCIDEIQLSNIRLTTNGINSQDILPDNVFDWYEWENNDFEYSFDLSALKPHVSYQEKIVGIHIDYGCIGSIVLPSISYNINDGTEIVDSGDITESHQVNAPQTITTKFTSTDSNQLFTFRIQGSAEGLGYFYILDTSFITIEVLPVLQENDTLERGIKDTISYVTPPSDPLVLTFKDFFRFTPNYQKFNISLSFSLINEFGSSIRLIHILMKFDFTIIFDEQISFEKLITLNERKTLYSQVYEVTIILTLYGDGDVITLNDLKYSLFSSSESENTSNPISFPEIPASEPITPSKSLMLIEYGIILLFVTVLLTQHFQRKRIADTTTETFYQTEVGIMGAISKLLMLPRKWWLKAKESMFRLYLLPSSICYIVWKTNTLYKIIAEFNSIANNSILHPQLTVLGKWGFYSFFLCSSASNLVLLSALYLTFVSTFYVDLFKFSKVLGVNTLFIYIPSSILVLFYMVSNSFKIKTFGIIILYILLLNIIVTLILFGRTKNKQTETVKSSFFKANVSRITNENESSDSLISVEGNNLSEEQYNDYKQSIINYIIDKITPEIQVSVNRFSEQFHISIELAHKLLIDVSNDYPGLGKYYIEEQIYKRSPDNEIGSINLDIHPKKKLGELIQYVDNNKVNKESSRRYVHHKSSNSTQNIREDLAVFLKEEVETIGFAENLGYHIPSATQELMNAMSIICINLENKKFEVNPRVEEILGIDSKGIIMDINRKIIINEPRIKPNNGKFILDKSTARSITIAEMFGLKDTRDCVKLTYASKMIGDFLQYSKQLCEVLNERFTDLIENIFPNDFDKRNEVEKRQWYCHLANRVLVELLKVKEKYLKSIENVSFIAGIQISKQTKTILSKLNTMKLAELTKDKGEFAVLFWFLRALLMFTYLSDVSNYSPRVRELIESKLKIMFEEHFYGKWEILRTNRQTEEKMKLCSFYEFFMDFILTTKQKTDGNYTVTLSGVKFIEPIKTMYKDNIFNLDLPRTYNEIYSKFNSYYIDENGVIDLSHIKKDLASHGSMMNVILSKEFTKIRFDKDGLRKGKFIIIVKGEGERDEDYVYPRYNEFHEPVYIQKGFYEIESKSGWQEKNYALSEEQYTINGRFGTIEDCDLNVIYKMMMCGYFSIIIEGEEIKPEELCKTQNPIKQLEKTVYDKDGNLRKIELRSMWMTDRMSPREIAKEPKSLLRMLRNYLLVELCIDRTTEIAFFDNYLQCKNSKKRGNNFYEFIETIASLGVYGDFEYTKHDPAYPVLIDSRIRQLISLSSAIVLMRSLTSLIQGHPTIALAKSTSNNLIKNGIYMPASSRSRLNTPSIAAWFEPSSTNPIKVNFTYEIPVGVRYPSNEFKIHTLSHHTFHTPVRIVYKIREDFQNYHIMAPIFQDKRGIFLLVFDKNTQTTMMSYLEEEDNYLVLNLKLRQEKFVVASTPYKGDFTVPTIHRPAVNVFDSLVLGVSSFGLDTNGEEVLLNKNRNDKYFEPLLDKFSTQYTTNELIGANKYLPMLAFVVYDNLPNCINTARSLLFPDATSTPNTHRNHHRYPIDAVSLSSFDFLVQILPPELFFGNDIGVGISNYVWRYIQCNEKGILDQYSRKGRYSDVGDATHFATFLFTSIFRQNSIGQSGKARYIFPVWGVIHSKKIVVEPATNKPFIKLTKPEKVKIDVKIKDKIITKEWQRIEMRIPYLFVGKISSDVTNRLLISSTHSKLLSCLVPNGKSFNGRTSRNPISPEQVVRNKFKLTEVFNKLTTDMKTLYSTKKLIPMNLDNPPFRYLDIIFKKNEKEELYSNREYFDIALINGKKTQILKPELFAKVFIKLFPELLKIHEYSITYKLGGKEEINAKDYLNSLEKAKGKEYANIILKYLNFGRNTVIHPSLIMFSLFGITHLYDWALRDKNNHPISSDLTELKPLPSSPEIMFKINEILAPYLFTRAYYLEEWFRNGKKTEMIFPEKLAEISKYEFEHIMGGNISDLALGTSKELSMAERWCWMWVKLAEYIDCLMYGYERYIPALERFKTIANEESSYRNFKLISELEPTEKAHLFDKLMKFKDISS